MSIEFADRLIYWHFRSAIRLGKVMGHLDAALIKKLLQSAMLDELTEQGFNKGAIAAAYNVSPATVTTWSKEALKPWSWPEGGHIMKRIIDCLAERGGGLPESDLEELCREGGLKRAKSRRRKRNQAPRSEFDEEGDGFTYRYVLALQRLKVLGYVEETSTASGATVVQLSKRWHEEASRTFVQPFDEECDILDLTVKISRHLLAHGGALSHQELTSEATARVLQSTPEGIHRALIWSQTLPKGGGSAPIRVEDRDGVRYYQLSPRAKVTSLDPINRQHAGAIHLVKELGSFLEWLASEPRQEEVAQKTIYFQVRRSELPELLKQHYHEFNRQVHAAQERAKGAQDVLNYTFLWMGYHTDERNTPPSKS